MGKRPVPKSSPSAKPSRGASGKQAKSAPQNPGLTSMSLDVRIGARHYDVTIGAGVLTRLGTIVKDCVPSGSRAFIVADAKLPESIVARARSSLEGAGLTVTIERFAVSEGDKSLASLNRILVAMAGTKLERRDPVIALGGGIVGDVAGFAAAVYRRGVPIVQCPTTLLSMVDASVGGKTGVNLDVAGRGSRTRSRGSDAGSLKKNLIGSFHQPSAVVADIETLRSLPRREFAAGLAECFKHGLLSGGFGDPGLYLWLRANLKRVLARESAVLGELVIRNVAVKASVVADDEREEAESSEGGRALLNLGHTFGHAIETIPTLSPDGRAAHAPLLHGEAVSLGLVAARRCAGLIRNSPLPRVSCEELEQDLYSAGLPVRVSGLPPSDRILASMMHDKKVSGGRLRLVLPGSSWTCRVCDGPPIEAVRASIDALRR